MTSNLSDDELLRSYLLGELPEPEADRLERRLLEEDELFLLCEAVEADLLAACDRGELAPAERDRVLRRLASSPRGRERLALACSLNAAADRDVQASVVPFPSRDAAAPPRPALRWAALAAAALLAVGGFWFALERMQEGGPATRGAHQISTPANTPPRRPATREKPAPQAETASTPEGSRIEKDSVAQQVEQKAPVRPERAEPKRVAFFLSLMTLRGVEGVEEFRVPPGRDIVEIQVDLEGVDDSGSFRASVRNRENGSVVWDKEDLEPRPLEWGSVLVLEIPAERLETGRYEVMVTSEGEESTQKFNVVQESR